MGYITYFIIGIEASRSDRRLAIINRILELATVSAADKTKVLAEYEKSSAVGVYAIRFYAEWYYWKRDVCGYWFCHQTNSIQDGIRPNEGESLSIHGYGSNASDIWKAFVTNRKFSQEHCASFIWTNKKNKCPSGKQCSGCMACADRKPIFD